MTSTTRQFSLAIGIAAALHGVLFLIAALLVFWGITAAPTALRVDPEAEENMLLLMLEAATKPETPPEAVPPTAPSLQFIRTGKDLATDTPPEPGTADFISDKNTRAASEAAPAPDGNPALPNQKGEDLLVLELATNQFAPGEFSPEERTKTGIGEESSPAQPAVPVPNLLEVVRSAQKQDAQKLQVAASPDVSSNPIIDPASDLVSDLLQETNEPPKIREPNLANIAPQEPAPAPNQTPKETPKQTTPADSPKQSPGIAGTPKGVNPNAGQTKTAQTAVKGSITNRGKSSVEAADTPMGRYMARVSAAFGQNFTPACKRHPDRLTYGTVSVEFDVNLKGGVENLRVVEGGVSRALMQDLVLGVVLETKLPPIPNDLRHYLIGDRLHITYGFLFY